MSLDTLRTPRLLAERIRAEDYGFLLKLSQDERVTAHIGGPRTEERVRENLAVALKQWDERGYGLYVVREAAGGAPVGQTGLFYREVDGIAQTDLGYSFVPEAWGRGYATEICAAVLDAVRLPSVVAFLSPANAASRRVLEKLGFAYEKEFDYKGERSALYRLRARG